MLSYHDVAYDMKNQQDVDPFIFYCILNLLINFVTIKKFILIIENIVILY
jgi:hypothetical protein